MMNHHSFTLASFTARAAVATSLTLLAAAGVGCLGEPETEPVGEAKSAVVSAKLTSYTSETDATGIATPPGFPNCVLAGVQGNFDKGQSSDPSFGGPAASFSQVGVPNNDGKLLAHGGLYADANNDPEWAGNTVGGFATCFGSSDPSAGSAFWGGDGSSYTPVKIAALATGRQCFLEYLEAADGTFYYSTDTVQVSAHTTTDSQHPTTGWYIEGTVNLASHGGDGWPAAQGVCYDFPDATEFGTYSITSTSGVHNTKATYANASAGCGLTAISGPFTNNSLTSGVWLDFNASGMWQLHAYGGQAGTAVCID